MKVKKLFILSCYQGYFNKNKQNKCKMPSFCLTNVVVHISKNE